MNYYFNEDKTMRLYNGDCIEIMDKLIEVGAEVDLTVTSPPYDNLRNYNNSLQWDFDIFKKVADRLYKITKDGGVVVWVVNDKTDKGNETLTSFKQALYFQQIGFNVHDTMIWRKTNPFNFGSNNCYIQSFEYMFVFSKGKPKAINLIYDRENKTIEDGYQFKYLSRKGDDLVINKSKTRSLKKIGKRYNVWDIKGGKKVGTHTATFPEEIPRDHIISWSNEGDLVLDCFMGSNTTGKMCKELKRNFIGIEKVKEYFNLSIERIK